MNSKSAVIWNTIEAFGNQIVSILTMILLGRLLNPEDFGIFGMIAIVTITSSVLIEGGIAAAIIYKKEISQVELSTLFFFNTIIALIVIVTIVFTSNLIADFFSEPRLENVLYLLSISFLFNSIGVVPFGILAKEMNFKLISKIRITTQILSGIIAIIMALLNYGVWALVAQTISSSFFTAILFFYFVRWRPNLIFRVFESIESIKYGLNIVFSGLLSSVFDNFYYIIIGRYYSSVDLGYFYQASKFQNISSNKIKSILQQSTFPVFSRISAEKKETETFFFSSLNNSIFVNFFISGLFFILAQDLVPFLLGYKWSSSVFYIKVLCVSSIFVPLFTLIRNLLLSQGKSFFNLSIDFLSKIILIVIIYFTINLSLKILVLGQVVFSFIMFFIFIIVLRNLNFKWMSSFVLIVKYLIITGLLIYFIPIFFISVTCNVILKMFLEVFIYTSLYIIFTLLFTPKNFLSDKVYILNYFKK